MRGQRDAIALAVTEKKNPQKNILAMIKTKNPKPMTGRLVQKLPSGKIIVLESGKPFAILCIKKKEYEQRGFKRLIITY